MKVNMNLKLRGYLVFLSLAVMVTVVCGLVYASVQQVYRNGANDPQVEASEQIYEAIKAGTPVENIAQSISPVAIDQSLGLFVAMFDKDGKLVGSSGQIGQDSPTPPSGVFDSAKAKGGSNRFTWQPQKGVRIAAVIKQLDGDHGYVLVGRNLREVENRINELTIIVVIAWAVLLILSAFMTWLFLGAHKTVVIEEINEEIHIQSPPVREVGAVAEIPTDSVGETPTLNM